MLAMQYSVRLPTGSDIEEASNRVEKRRNLFQGLSGLAHKTYLYDEEERLYAPIYLWRSHQAAQEFLVDGLFDDVVSTFGRPRVRSWNILDFGYGKSTVRPKFACYESDRVEASDSLSRLLSKEREIQQQCLEDPMLFARFTALDADRWELARFSFWAEENIDSRAAADCVQTYRILDVCEGEDLLESA